MAAITLSEPPMSKSRLPVVAPSDMATVDHARQEAVARIAHQDPIAVDAARHRHARLELVGHMSWFIDDVTDEVIAQLDRYRHLRSS